MTRRPLRQLVPLPDLGLLVAGVLAFLGFGAVLVVVLVGGASTVDRAVASRTVLLRGGVTSPGRVISALGSPAVIVLAALAAVTGLRVQTRQLWASAILASSLLATTSFVTLLRLAVGRPRPGLDAVVAPGRGSSFPSGLTATATLVYVLGALLLTGHLRRACWRRMVIGVAVALALLIGLSRIWLGDCWATDVLAGWLLAVGVILGSWITSRRLGLADERGVPLEPALTSTTR
jgi:undecaprenyl-diphosphatase